MSDLRGKIPTNIATLTRQVRKTYAHVHKVISGKVTPSAALAIAIERATDGAITRSDLRPDLWPHASSSLDTAV